MKVLLIDNYDSFVYNIAQYLGELGASISTCRNDEVNVKDVKELQPDKIVLSPVQEHRRRSATSGIAYPS